MQTKIVKEKNNQEMEKEKKDQYLHDVSRKNKSEKGKAQRYGGALIKKKKTNEHIRSKKQQKDEGEKRSKTKRRKKKQE